ncbi:MAG: DUF1499 domain-containing protein [Mesorhizobium sp.]
MAALIKRQFSASALWSRRVAYFSLVLLGVSAGAHRFDFITTPALLGVLIVVAILALCAIALAAVGISRLWRRGDKAGRNATAGILMALVALTPFMTAGVANFYFPELNDISTDLDRPPELALGEGTRGPLANPPEMPLPSQAAVQSQAYPDTIGRLFEAPPEQVAAAVLAEAEDRHWVTLDAPVFGEGIPELTYEFTARTLFFGFVADVAVRITGVSEASLVDMRSASRYGTHDFGDNARRIASFLAAVDARLKAIPPAQAGL